MKAVCSTSWYACSLSLNCLSWRSRSYRSSGSSSSASCLRGDLDLSFLRESRLFSTDLSNKSARYRGNINRQSVASLGRETSGMSTGLNTAISTQHRDLFDSMHQSHKSHNTELFAWTACTIKHEIYFHSRTSTFVSYDDIKKQMKSMLLANQWLAVWSQKFSIWRSIILQWYLSKQAHTWPDYYQSMEDTRGQTWSEIVYDSAAHRGRDPVACLCLFRSGLCRHGLYLGQSDLCLDPCRICHVYLPTRRRDACQSLCHRFPVYCHLSSLYRQVLFQLPPHHPESGEVDCWRHRHDVHIATTITA